MSISFRLQSQPGPLPRSRGWPAESQDGARRRAGVARRGWLSPAVRPPSPEDASVAKFLPKAPGGPVESSRIGGFGPEDLLRWRRRRRQLNCQ